MKLIVCVDDFNGMMFNHRRQSQDRFLRERVLRLVGEAPIYMTPYTKRQFEDADNIIVADAPPKSSPEAYYFWEDGEVDISSFDGVIVYRWNRHYPADRYFKPELLNGFELCSTDEFKGYSHERITEQIFKKR